MLPHAHKQEIPHIMEKTNVLGDLFSDYGSKLHIMAHGPELQEAGREDRLMSIGFLDGEVGNGKDVIIIPGRRGMTWADWAVHCC